MARRPGILRRGPDSEGEESAGSESGTSSDLTPRTRPESSSDSIDDLDYVPGFPKQLLTELKTWLTL